eukprot:jgi/Ulvmu1/9187/UM005_0287.1
MNCCRSMGASPRFSPASGRPNPTVLQLRRACRPQSVPPTPRFPSFPSKSLPPKLAGCVALSVLVTLGATGWLDPATAATNTKNPSSPDVVRCSIGHDGTHTHNLARIDAAERAWQNGAATTPHVSRFAANPVMDVAAQPAMERPTSSLMNSLFVLTFALPGLAMFFGGLSRAGSVNSALMSGALSMSVVSIVWYAGAYSGAFSTSGMTEGTINIRSFVGSLDKAFLSGITSSTLFRGLPELTWFLFQLKLAIIASTIAMGGLIERAKLSAKILMTSLWVPVVYVPIAHAVAAGPGSLLGDIGIMDFAGSLATHVAPGVSALIAAAAVGGGRQSAPGAHNSPMTAIGMILLWIGCLGQASGAAAIAGTSSAAVLVNTQLAAAVSALTWLCFDVAAQQQSLLGVSCGAVAGLVAVTPAMAYISAPGAMVIGLVATTAAWVCVTLLLSRGWYDDCVRLYGTAAAAAATGSVLTGVVCNPFYGGTGAAGPVLTQLVVQLVAVGAVVGWAAVGTWLLAQSVALLCGGLRVASGTGGADAVLKD